MVATTVGVGVVDLVEDICAALARIEATEDENSALSGKGCPFNLAQSDSPEDAIFMAYRERQREREIESFRQAQEKEEAERLRRREEVRAMLAVWPRAASQEEPDKAVTVCPKPVCGKDTLFSDWSLCFMTRVC